MRFDMVKLPWIEVCGSLFCRALFYPVFIGVSKTKTSCINVLLATVQKTKSKKKVSNIKRKASEN